MKKILLIYKGQEAFCEELKTMLEPNRMWLTATTIEDSLEIIKAHPDIATVLIDTPSEYPGIRRVIDHINVGNNYVYSASILLLTDTNHVEQDISFLGGAVLDCIQKPIWPAIFRSRIDNAEKCISSVSFSEFAEMLKALPANIYLKDSFGRYVFSSQTWHHLDTGENPDWTIRGKTDLDIRKDKENAKLALASDLELIRTGKGTSYVIEETDAGQEFLQIIKEPLFYEDGRVRGIIALINNVTEQEQLRRKLREQSITDQMTGVYNRTYYAEFVQQLSEHMSFPMGIISADCDNLKKINDTYGHMVGDEYIRMCLMLLRVGLPENSILFRIGGDEFVALVPEATEPTLQKMLDDIRENAATYQVKGRQLSVSLGFSIMRSAADDFAEHLKLSDTQMYEDKRRKG
ncbi:MAG: diguanylate cyclase [Lachnospiraceae bacterium]|nr:diguanylate cyclase [Eubacterium sp.]MBR1771932.1 diguanylate cyclase [Lachnospiraceae bacterium]MBR1852481.1 diguanylate cyclase [Lachnospiraceae bacterium]